MSHRMNRLSVIYPEKKLSLHTANVPESCRAPADAPLLSSHVALPDEARPKLAAAAGIAETVPPKQACPGLWAGRIKIHIRTGGSNPLLSHMRRSTPTGGRSPGVLVRVLPSAPPRRPGTRGADHTHSPRLKTVPRLHVCTSTSHLWAWWGCGRPRVQAKRLPSLLHPVQSRWSLSSPYTRTMWWPPCMD